MMERGHDATAHSTGDFHDGNEFSHANALADQLEVISTVQPDTELVSVEPNIHSANEDRLRSLTAFLQKIDNDLSGGMITASTRVRLLAEKAAIIPERQRLIAAVEEPKELDEATLIMNTRHRNNFVERYEGISDDERQDDEMMMQRLGFLNEAGRFHFPTEIFSSASIEAWVKYLESVIKNTDKVAEWRAIKATGEQYDTVMANAEIKATDVIRGADHDAFTRQLMQEMGLSSDDENFTKTRRLASKMREQLLPNTGEVQSTNDALKLMSEKMIQEIRSDVAHERAA